jgi:hypothetical protein
MGIGNGSDHVGDPGPAVAIATPNVRRVREKPLRRVLSQLCLDHQ